LDEGSSFFLISPYFYYAIRYNKRAKKTQLFHYNRIDSRLFVLALVLRIYKAE